MLQPQLKHISQRRRMLFTIGVRILGDRRRMPHLKPQVGAQHVTTLAETPQPATPHAIYDWRSDLR